MHIVIAALHRPNKPTGVCRHAVNLALCLAGKPQISKVTLLVGAWQREYFLKAFNLDAEKIQLRDIAIKNSSINRNLWFLLGLPRIINQLQPDLVHLSFPLPFLRPLFRVPVVSTIHDVYPYECPENFGYPNVLFNQWFLQQCIHNSDGLACVSKTTLGQLNIFFPWVSSNKKSTVLYNYVDFEQVQAACPDNQGEWDHPFILCVAQHRKNKNLDVLIKAFSTLIVRKHLPSNARLVLVGSTGPETDNLILLSQQSGLHDRIHMLSAISDAQLRWLYENCQLFVMPSSTEGFCIPLVEAISLSCSIVCSEIPIFRELGLGESTFFDLTNNPIEHLVDAIVETLAKVQSSTCQPVTRFSKEATANQCLLFYADILHHEHVEQNVAGRPLKS